MSGDDAEGRQAPGAGSGHARPVLLRHQSLALHAYGVVGKVSGKQQRKDYERAVKNLGANILRSGLAAAMAALERRSDRGKRLLDHLARAGIPGLEAATADDLPERVRGLDVDAYMIATRQMLHLAAWLKRAAQATFVDDDDAEQAEIG
ncbi:MAG: type III-B CRISPR module-associated protein Cmr5 [Acidobacteriota bacterium]